VAAQRGGMKHFERDGVSNFAGSHASSVSGLISTRENYRPRWRTTARTRAHFPISGTF
jgi:hypothetical protein